MKTKLVTLLVLIIGIALTSTTFAKDPKKEKTHVTFLVSMKCENCQKRIADNLSFEKGVTDLDIDLSRKTVTIEYQPDKTSPDKLREAIRKLGYTAAPFRTPKPKSPTQQP